MREEWVSEREMRRESGRGRGSEWENERERVMFRGRDYSWLFPAKGTSALTKSLTTVFYVIGKFGIGVSFSAIFVYTPELYPTNLR